MLGYVSFDLEDNLGCLFGLVVFFLKKKYMVWIDLGNIIFFINWKKKIGNKKKKKKMVFFLKRYSKIDNDSWYFFLYFI